MVCPYTYAAENVAVSTQPQPGENTYPIHMVGSDYEWGYRVFGELSIDRFFIGLSYAQLNAKNVASTIGFNLVFPGGNSNLNFLSKVIAHTSIDYQNFDVKIGVDFRRTCQSRLYAYGNVRWVDLSYSRGAQQYSSVATAIGFISQKVAERSKFEGTAIGLGLGGQREVWCGLGLFGDANILGIIGERRVMPARYERYGDWGGNPGFLNRTMIYPSQSCVIPELDFRIGVDYRYTCGCFTLIGEVGYEVDYFWNVFAFPALNGGDYFQNQPTAHNNGGFVLKCENAGFSGLFFGGRLVY